MRNRYLAQRAYARIAAFPWLLRHIVLVFVCRRSRHFFEDTSLLPGVSDVRLTLGEFCQGDSE